MAATNSDDLARTLTALSEVLIADDGVDESLQRVATLSTSLIGTCDSCGVSLVRDGSFYTRAASDERADRVDEIQYSEGVGPCLEAIVTGEPVHVDSFAEERRWLPFIERAREEGIRASYSVPLRVRSEVVGSLNFYSCGGSFSEHDEQIGDMLAAQAAVGLRNAQTFAEALEMVEQLNEALQSRDVIGQSKGMLMTRFDVDPDEAFDLLRRFSQRSNRKLRDVAAEVAEGTIALDELAPDTAPTS